MVYVISKEGKPLMPCKEAKARHLLEANRAKVVKRVPFTIRLLFECENQVQDVSLGVDAGSKTIGLSATTEDKVLFEANVELRNDVVDLIATRREARRTRRVRKTRYRQPRYNNRKKEDGRLAPSVQQKIETHINIIKEIHKFLPISNIVVEVASFDIQKIKNPDISGTDYQQGDQLGFWNVREYVFFRDNHTCQCCKGKSGNKVLNVHHIESRKTGGNSPSNLITLCETCHKDYHLGKIKLPDRIKRGVSFRDAAFMGIMRWAFYNKLKETYPNVDLTYGYITKSIRIENNLQKDHYIDARCISGHPKATNNDKVYLYKKVRRHNRKIYKDKILKGGIIKRNQCPYKIFGYHRYDLVNYFGQLCYINSLRACGRFQLKSLSDSNYSKEVSYKKIQKVQTRSGYLIDFYKIA